MTPPEGAEPPFWGITHNMTFTITLDARQTYALRTRGGKVLDGALVVASNPVAARAGGRGWGVAPGQQLGCGDEGSEVLLGAHMVGSRYVLSNFRCERTPAVWELTCCCRPVLLLLDYRPFVLFLSVRALASRACKRTGACFIVRAATSK